MRKMFGVIFLIVIVSLLFVSTTYSVQIGGAKGKTINGMTGTPLSEVDIIATTSSNLENEQKYLTNATKSDKNGNFEIKGIRGKNYKIVFFKKGHVPEYLVTLNRGITVTIPAQSNLIIDNPLKLYPRPVEWLEFSPLTVKDLRTKLIWYGKKPDIGERGKNYTPEQIVQRLKILNDNNYAGYNDWRCPSLAEAMQMCKTAGTYAQKCGMPGLHYGNSVEYFRWLGIENAPEETIIELKLDEGFKVVNFALNNPCGIIQRPRGSVTNIWAVSEGQKK